MCQILEPDKRITQHHAKAAHLSKCQTSSAGDISLWIIKRADVERGGECSQWPAENNGVEGK